MATETQPSDGPAAQPGLRERKRLRTRREISDVATRLFVERGFERVTLAEIAEAADVSVKTIFNHFGSKEELFFDRVDEVRARFESTVTDGRRASPCSARCAPCSRSTWSRSATCRRGGLSRSRSATRCSGASRRRRTGRPPSAPGGR